jgi:glycosyltransferase involved in cell wall biosynthesis
MKVAVLAGALSEKSLHGIGYYTLNLLRELARLDKSNDFFLYSNREFKWNVNEKNVHEKQLKFPYAWSYLRFPLEFTKSKNKYDLVFIPKEVVPPFLASKSVITTFDLMHLHFPRDITSVVKRHFNLAEKYAFPRAKKILTISEDTKNDLVKLCGVDERKIIVTPLGYDKDIFRPRSLDVIAPVLDKYKITRPYFINVSSYWWFRKNLISLIRSYAMSLKQGYHDNDLVITGKRGPLYDEMVSLCNNLNIQNRVHMLEYVPIHDLAILLNGAFSMLFPSLHEGFGLPIIEAMASGCPVLTSNCSAMPEAAGRAAILVDPLDEEAIKNGIIMLASNTSLLNELRELGFTQAKKFDWSITARKTLDVFQEMVS